MLSGLRGIDITEKSCNNNNIKHIKHLGGDWNEVICKQRNLFETLVCGSINVGSVMRYEKSKPRGLRIMLHLYSF